MLNDNVCILSLQHLQGAYSIFGIPGKAIKGVHVTSKTIKAIWWGKNKSKSD